MTSSINSTSFQKQTPISSSQTGVSTAPKESHLSLLSTPTVTTIAGGILAGITGFSPFSYSLAQMAIGLGAGLLVDHISPLFSTSTSAASEIASSPKKETPKPQTTKTPSAQEQPKSRSTTSPKRETASVSQQIVAENPVTRKFRSISDTNCSGEIVGVYITTNEKGADKTLTQLKRTPPSPRSMHVGFSGWHNFDIMWARQVERGLICDFNPHNKDFIEKTLKVLKISRTRQEFVANMEQVAKDLRKQNLCYFSPNFERECCDAEEEIEQELTTKGSWLSSEKSFQFIKSLAETDSVAAITLDIRNTTSFKRIASIAENNDIQIDTLYLSNICAYMFKPKDKRDFLGTVHALARPETTVINCPIGGEVLRQEILPGTELQKPENDIRLFVSDSPTSEEARQKREHILKQLAED